VQLLNSYGPTEATIVATACDLTAPSKAGVMRGKAYIGTPVANVKTYVLDARLEPVPIGVAGELYIGGEGVARGYLGRPGLTAERFIPDPYSAEVGRRLYRTGDLARYLGDGTIDYVGRSDNQVKVRGYRIELGEIESALTQHADVGEVAVIARKDSAGGKRLVAYVATRRGQEVEAGRLREFLRARLPEHMVPAAFVVLDELPLTPNGKVDRRALPAPDSVRGGGERSYDAPRDALELELCRVWEDVLGVSPVGVRDNFFELGGHSLMAVRLIERVNKLTKRQVPLASIFRAATVESLAELLREQAAPVAASSLVEIQKGGSRPPLFFVHPAGGNVFRYVELARLLGPEQPFYGLQAQGLDGGLEAHTRVEEMAAHYVGLIRGLGTAGPYRLGGWSLGGVVAFEMARQLRAAGEEVELVALLDSYATQSVAVDDDGADDAEADLYAQFIQHLGLSVSALAGYAEEFRRLAGDERLAFVLERIMAAEDRYARLGAARMRRLFEVFETHTRAARAYRPGPFDGRVALFAASEGGGEAAAAGWSALAAGGLDFRLMPGDHYTLLERPNVEVLAGELGARLQGDRLESR
jgi:thioesterase domain-containing protein